VFNNTFSTYKLYRARRMKYILCTAGGTHSNINKPNERKIHTNKKKHLGYVEIISSPH